MAAFPEGARLMQGDFLDGVVESTLRSIVGQLKAEYRKELGRALETASSEAAGADRTDAPAATVPSLNTPATHPGEDQDADAVERIRLSPGCPEPGSARKVFASAWRDSRQSGGTAWARPSAGGLWEETMDKPNEKRNDNVALTKQDEQEIVRLREEQIRREQAAERLVRGYAFILDPALDEASGFRMVLRRIIASPKFDFGMGFVILLNALTIGSETAISRHGGQIPASLHLLEYTFLLLYCVELGMRVYAFGLQAFSNNWIKFDVVMVGAGMLNFLLTLTSFGGDAAAGMTDNIKLMKLIRLFRLAKTVRVLVQFRTLWMLVQGLMYAVMPMIWTALLMTVVIYVFAIIAMEIILVSDADSEYSAAARQYDTLGGSMLTLMQFMTLDSVAVIYTPLISKKPWLALYFVIFILLGPIALMNIVTAIMVESSLRTANEDQEAKKVWEQVRRKEMMPKLRQMFIDLDQSGDGEVDLQEVLTAPPHLKETMQHIVGLDELEEIFHLLDYDGSGSVDIEEFVEGILRTKGEKPSELFVILKQGKAILNRLKGLGLRPSLRSSGEAVVDGRASQTRQGSNIS